MSTEFITCRHIKTDGRRCKSPALTGKPFCFFHTKLYKQHRNLAKTAELPPPSAQNPPELATPSPIELHLPPLEDAESIQLSISLVIAAIAGNRLDLKRAHMLLYGLQLAASNVRSVNTAPYATSIVREAVQTKSGYLLAPPEA